MKEIQITTTVTVKADGEILTGKEQEAAVAADDTVYYDDAKEITEDEAERYAVASDLANVCDYLEDSEVIKIKLIIQKAQARKERAEEK